MSIHTNPAQIQLIARMRELSFHLGRAEAQNAPAPQGAQEMLDICWNTLTALLVEEAMDAAISGDDLDAEHFALICCIEQLLSHSTADGRRSVISELIA